MYEAALPERLEIHERAQLHKERDRFQMVLEAVSFALFNDWIAASFTRSLHSKNRK
jgi:hypothetical protein